MSFLQKIQSAVKLEFQKLYFTKVNSYTDVVWLIGAARSGTTWVANLMNHDYSSRIMFEPIHPFLIKGMEFLEVNQYVGPNEERKRLNQAIDKIFTGKLTQKRVDKDNVGFSYNKLIVKDIYANLLAYHVVKRLPRVKPVFLIRHPFAVANSVYGKKNWLWQTDPRDFLKQEQLMSDYLEPFRALINEISKDEDFITRQVLIWAIVNYVPLKQFKEGELLTLFYEDVLENPRAEIAKVKKLIYPEESDKIEISDSLILTPSKVSTKNGRSYKDNLWEKNMTEQQREVGVRILKAFGLNELYNDDSSPNHEGLKNFKR